MKYLLPFFLLLLALPSHGQRLRRFVTYYDSLKTHRREVYTALVAADTVPQGTYKRFYRNGKPEQQTSFTQGKRDSAYVEFHPTGTRRLEATYRDGVRQGPFKTYYDDGKVAQEGSFVDDVPTGELTYYHPDGSVRLKTTLANGQPNGALKAVYPNGVVQSEGTFTRGLLSGPYLTRYPNNQIEVEVLADKTGKGRYRSFYPSGKLQTESTYVPAPLVQRAVKNQLGDDLTKRAIAPTGTTNLDGPATSYYESGQIKTKLTYKNGVPTGHGLEYFENGNLHEDTDYGNNGRDRRITRYQDAPGKLKQAEEIYKNNRPSGTWQQYYPDGKTLREAATYGPSGRLLGERLTYFDNGQVQNRQPYLNGFMSGVGQEYFPSGKVKKETNYVRSMIQGPFRELREDGTVAVSGQYRNSKQSGEWTYYKEDGTTVDRTVTYRNGVLVDPIRQPKAKPKAPVKRR